MTSEYGFVYEASNERGRRRVIRWQLAEPMTSMTRVSVIAPSGEPMLLYGVGREPRLFFPTFELAKAELVAEALPAWSRGVKVMAETAQGTTVPLIALTEEEVVDGAGR